MVCTMDNNNAVALAPLGLLDPLLIFRMMTSALNSRSLILFVEAISLSMTHRKRCSLSLFHKLLTNLLTFVMSLCEQKYFCFERIDVFRKTFFYVSSKVVNLFEMFVNVFSFTAKISNNLYMSILLK